MMAVIVVFGIPAIVIVAGFWLLIKTNVGMHKRKPHINETQTVEFSVSEYLDRVEREALKLCEESEKQEPLKIVLWWGLDGLQLNDDGSLEWIRRKSDGRQAAESRDFQLNGGAGGEGGPAYISYFPYSSPVNSWNYLTNSVDNSVQTYLYQLHRQLAQCCCSINQSYQSSAIISAIQPSVIPDPENARDITGKVIREEVGYEQFR